MDIVIIGSGNVAHCFSHSFKLHGHRIKQILSRNPENARILAEKLNAPFESNFKKIYKEADAYIIAVKDDAIKKMADKLSFDSPLVAHTSGAMNLDVLKDCSKNYGVLYPLQTITKEDFSKKKIPLLIEGNSNLSLSRLKALGNAISDTLIEMSSEKRLKMHFAATFSNNFPNFLATLCKTYCKNENLDYKLLTPLLEETFRHMVQPLKKSRQTGPAIRNDTQTMKKHEELIHNYPQIKELYKIINRSIQAFYEDKKI